MSLELKSCQDKLLFIPLGGAGEIGMNLNLYQYKGKWLMVDCGAGFADDYLPGIDLIVADISAIKPYVKDIVGLVLTHAHEDHLGGVQYLWNEIGCPIYATKFTANFLETRLKEYFFEKKVEVNHLEPKSSFKLGPFDIEMIALTHSAPEMQALMIRTEAGNILHTGDWKFDNNPVVGEVSDMDGLKRCGDEGVLALVCDSTNVFNQGSSGSEGDLIESLSKIIAECRQMVVVTTFASNLARLNTLLEIAKNLGKKVVIAGKSLHRIIEVAIKSGYELNSDIIINERDISRFRRDELVVISTGCQGEPLAATAKMAYDSHPAIKLLAGDTVIFSSKIIPGNEKRIFRLFNIFAKKNVDVITEKDHFVHVSGHPSVDELKKMYELVRPKVAIPVHGELVHIHEHAKLAKGFGVKDVVKVENGLVVDLVAAGVIGHVESGYLAVDGNYLLPSNSSVIKMRRKMMDTGIIIVVLVVNRSGGLLTKPVILFPGCLDYNDDRDLIESIEEDIYIYMSENKHNKKSSSSDETIKSSIRSLIKKALKNETGKIPVIEVSINRN